MKNAAQIKNEIFKGAQFVEATDEVLDMMEAMIGETPVEEMTDEEIAAELNTYKEALGEGDSFNWELFFAESTPRETALWDEKHKREKAEEIRAKAMAAGMVYKKEYKKCGKCGGNGRLDCYSHISNGICFRCGGGGWV